jgi:hypothetical protein
VSTADRLPPPASQPIPVDRLVEQVCDDGADFNDCVMGYHSGQLETVVTADGLTEMYLVLRFRRDFDAEADPGDDWGDADYRFKLVADESLRKVLT